MKSREDAIIIDNRLTRYEKGEISLTSLVEDKTLAWYFNPPHTIETDWWLIDQYYDVVSSFRNCEMGRADVHKIYEYAEKRLDLKGESLDYFVKCMISIDKYILHTHMEKQEKERNKGKSSNKPKPKPVKK